MNCLGMLALSVFVLARGSRWCAGARMVAIDDRISLKSPWYKENARSRPRGKSLRFLLEQLWKIADGGGALVTKHARDELVINSGGTSPGKEIKAGLAEASAEIGAEMSGGELAGLNPELLRTADRIVALGSNAQLELPEDAKATMNVGSSTSLLSAVSRACNTCTWFATILTRACRSLFRSCRKISSRTGPACA